MTIQGHSKRFNHRIPAQFSDAGDFQNCLAAIRAITEAARAHRQERMPWSMLSRGIAGTIGDMLVLTLPGSTGGATETMDALFPAVLHVFRIFAAARHD